MGEVKGSGKTLKIWIRIAGRSEEEAIGVKLPSNPATMTIRELKETMIPLVSFDEFPITVDHLTPDHLEVVCGTEVLQDTDTVLQRIDETLIVSPNAAACAPQTDNKTQANLRELWEELPSSVTPTSPTNQQPPAAKPAAQQQQQQQQDQAGGEGFPPGKKHEVALPKPAYRSGGAPASPQPPPAAGKGQGEAFAGGGGAALALDTVEPHAHDPPHSHRSYDSCPPSPQANLSGTARAPPDSLLGAAAARPRPASVPSKSAIGRSKTVALPQKPGATASPAVNALFKSGTVAYEATRDLKPVPHVTQLVFSKALDDVRKQDWQLQFAGLTLLRRIATFHPHFLTNSLQSVLLAVAACLKTLRSAVQKNALLTFSDIVKSECRDMKALDAQLEPLAAEVLRLSTGDNNFIREAADECFDDIVKNVNDHHRLRLISRMLASAMNSKNPTVRAQCVKIITDCSRSVAPEHLKSYTKMSLLLKALHNFIVDASESCRHSARGLAQELADRFGGVDEFATSLHQHLSAGQTDTLCRAMGAGWKTSADSRATSVSPSGASSHGRTGRPHEQAHAAEGGARSQTPTGSAANPSPRLRNHSNGSRRATSPSPSRSAAGGRKKPVLPAAAVLGSSVGSLPSCTSPTHKHHAVESPTHKKRSASPCFFHELPGEAEHSATPDLSELKRSPAGAGVVKRACDHFQARWGIPSMCQNCKLAQSAHGPQSQRGVGSVAGSDWDVNSAASGTSRGSRSKTVRLSSTTGSLSPVRAVRAPIPAARGNSGNLVASPSAFGRSSTHTFQTSPSAGTPTLNKAAARPPTAKTGRFTTSGHASPPRGGSDRHLKGPVSRSSVGGLSGSAYADDDIETSTTERTADLALADFDDVHHLREEYQKELAEKDSMIVALLKENMSLKKDVKELQEKLRERTQQSDLDHVTILTTPDFGDNVNSFLVGCREEEMHRRNTPRASASLPGGAAAPAPSPAQRPQSSSEGSTSPKTEPAESTTSSSSQSLLSNVKAVTADLSSPVQPLSPIAEPVSAAETERTPFAQPLSSDARPSAKASCDDDILGVATPGTGAMYLLSPESPAPGEKEKPAVNGVAVHTGDTALPASPS
ncbi:CLIP-associating protein [Diplonema papillatum]|nr:CLIP-associating protein [Diplonema papillatum]